MKKYSIDTVCNALEKKGVDAWTIICVDRNVGYWCTKVRTNMPILYPNKEKLFIQPVNKIFPAYENYHYKLGEFSEGQQTEIEKLENKLKTASVQGKISGGNVEENDDIAFHRATATTLALSDLNLPALTAEKGGEGGGTQAGNGLSGYLFVGGMAIGGLAVLYLLAEQLKKGGTGEKRGSEKGHNLL